MINARKRLTAASASASRIVMDLVPRSPQDTMKSIRSPCEIRRPAHRVQTRVSLRLRTRSRMHPVPDSARSKKEFQIFRSSEQLLPCFLRKIAKIQQFCKCLFFHLFFHPVIFIPAVSVPAAQAPLPQTSDRQTVIPNLRFIKFHSRFS